MMADEHGSSGLEEAVEIDYTNHRGERAVRHVVPDKLYFGTTEWHREPQWLLLAFDLGKNATRTFAMQDVHSWKQVVLEPDEERRVREEAKETYRQEVVAKMIVPMKEGAKKGRDDLAAMVGSGKGDPAELAKVKLMLDINEEFIAHLERF